MSVDRPAKFSKLCAVPLGAARWTDGFWADRFRVCRDATIPAMQRLMCQTERERFLGNFEVAAGLKSGRHRGPKWNDGDFYKWIEAAAATLALEPNEQLDHELDSIIELIARVQDPDGYIHTDVQIAQRAGSTDARRFANPMDFEMYNMGHLIGAACVHHRATGKFNLLTIARKAADFLAKEFHSPSPQQARHGICPSHLMGLMDLYHTTGEPRYRNLASTLLNMRDLVGEPARGSGDDDNQDRIPLRQETRAVGHAVRGTYLWAGAADVCAHTGDVTLLEPLTRIWQDLISHKLYITGGCGALFDGASPDGSEDQRSITRVHQAFGRNYQLPSSTAHNETCAAIGNLLWNWRMFLITGEARFADIVELTLYNSVLAGVSLDGTKFFYTNTLRQLEPMPVTLRWPRHRQKRLSCFCCPPNVARTIAQSSQYAYVTGEDDAIYVVLYGANVLETPELKLTQETQYPWDGHVGIEIGQAPARELSILLRIPSWAHGATASVNGRQIDASPRQDGFFEIRRAWSAGDLIELELPMPARMVEAHPLVEETRNHVALMCGPIVYCQESLDLPPEVRLLDVHVNRDAHFTTRANDELPGVTILKGEGVEISSQGWGEELYRDVTPSRTRPIPLRLIPYFAWDNRGNCEMSVWLPLVR